MERRFKAKTLVLKKTHLLIFLCLTAAGLFAVSADIPAQSLNTAQIFSSVLLCASNNDTFFPKDISVLKSGSTVFAYNPPKAVTTPEKAPEEPISQPEAKEAAVQSKPVSIPSAGIEMRNQTGYTPDTNALLHQELGFLPVEMNSSSPQVLLFHTHTTESFAGCDRTDNEELNVVAIGKVIAEYLNSMGVNTLHCKTVHDYDYNGSYSKSWDTVEKLLAENPSVKVVLDVHRDGITYEDGSGLRVVSEVSGDTVAQFMIVAGTDEGGLYHPDWKSNLSFGLKIQNRMNQKFPGLARPLNLRSERFNQSLSPGMLIIECGANGNTIDEVKKGAKLFSEALYDVISQ